MDYLLILVALAYFLISHLIAHFIGTKRVIGYGKSIFYSVLWTPLFGLLITLFSKKLES